jgi:uncharacterized protein YktA (UPF0223 family)
MKTTSERVDSNFMDLFDALVHEANSSGVEIMYETDLAKVANFLDRVTPRSKSRTDKEKLLDYLRIVKETNPSLKENYQLINKFVEPIVSKMLSKGGYESLGHWVVYFLIVLVMEGGITIFFRTSIGWSFPYVTLLVFLLASYKLTKAHLSCKLLLIHLFKV